MTQGVPLTPLGLGCRILSLPALMGGILMGLGSRVASNGPFQPPGRPRAPVSEPDQPQDFSEPPSSSARKKRPHEEAASWEEGEMTSAFPLSAKSWREMEKRKSDEDGGVLTYLERLEAQARESALKQEEEQQQGQKLAQLKAKVQELRAHRDKLRANLELQQKRSSVVPGTSLRTRPPPALCAAPTKVPLDGEFWERRVQIPLSAPPKGIHGKLTKRGVCFCITTAFEGTYLQSYYLDVHTKPEVRIQCHSVPIFIPLEQIARRHLQTDIRRFLAVLFDHLNAYDGRRYQVDQLQLSLSVQKHFSDRLEGTLQRNSLCNLVVFRYSVSGGSGSFLFSAKLVYSDLCCSLPAEAVVSCMPNAPAELAEMAAAHSETFRRLALHKAFASFSKAEETQDRAPINPPGSPQ
ncbi:Centromere protein O [Aix galericulata]|nr:Centromere protein O [Aix galericulata]